MSAGGDRLNAALVRNIPYIISLGATDMVNFGAMHTVPEKYRDRKLYQHNHLVTLMRTTKEECVEVGQYIVQKIRDRGYLDSIKDTRYLEVWLPRGGVSMMSKYQWEFDAGPPGIFADKEADDALFETIIDGLKGSDIRVVDDPRDINHPDFGKEIAESLIEMIRKGDGGGIEEVRKAEKRETEEADASEVLKDSATPVIN
jgi:uncharacterized protein (UPF0261 family)